MIYVSVGNVSSLPNNLSNSSGNATTQRTFLIEKEKQTMRYMQILRSYLNVFEILNIFIYVLDACRSDYIPSTT